MTTTKPSGLEYLSLSQIILSHMVDGFEGDGLKEAQRIVASRVVEGEKHLRELSAMFSRRYLNSKEPRIASFNNYHDYLRFIYDMRTSFVDDVVPYLDPLRLENFIDEIGGNGTVNSGNNFISSGVVGNCNGLILGSACSTVEIQNIVESLDYL